MFINSLNRTPRGDMRAEDYPEIRALPLFAEMDSARFERLMRTGYVQNFPPRVTLIEEGESADFLYVLVSGAVEMTASWNERETSMAIVRPVSAFILAATIRDGPYLMTAQTLEKSRIVLLASEDVRDVFEADAPFARAVVSELARAYRSMVKATKDLKLRTSMERLANFLVRAHLQAGGAATFELDIEKRRLASLLGMTPENLSRAIRSLEPFGVAFDNATVRMLDIDELTRFAKPTPLIDDPDH